MWFLGQKDKKEKSAGDQLLNNYGGLWVLVTKQFLPLLPRLICDTCALKPGKFLSSSVAIVTSMTFREDKKVSGSLGE